MLESSLENSPCDCELLAALRGSLASYGAGYPEPGEALPKSRVLVPEAVIKVASAIGKKKLEAAKAGRSRRPLPARFIDADAVPTWYPLALGLEELVSHRVRSAQRAAPQPASKGSELAPDSSVSLPAFCDRCGHTPIGDQAAAQTIVNNPSKQES